MDTSAPQDRWCAQAEKDGGANGGEAPLDEETGDGGVTGSSPSGPSPSPLLWKWGGSHSKALFHWLTGF